MKRFWIPVLWTVLLLIGIPLQIQVWTDPNLPTWLDLLFCLPLACACILLLRMIYDIWAFTDPFGKKNRPTFTEVSAVDLKTGQLLYVNNVLYEFAEMSMAVDEIRGTSSVITLRSIDTNRGHIRVKPKPYADGM